MDVSDGAVILASCAIVVVGLACVGTFLMGMGSAWLWYQHQRAQDAIAVATRLAQIEANVNLRYSELVGAIEPLNEWAVAHGGPTVPIFDAAKRLELFRTRFLDERGPLLEAASRWAAAESAETARR